MRTHVLLVFQDEFLRKIDAFLEAAWMVAHSRKMFDCTKEEYKQKVWQLLKGHYSHSPDFRDNELLESLPDELKNPVFSIVSKEEKGTLKLDSGFELPMYNYNGNLVAVSEIPKVLAVIGTHTRIAYNKDTNQTEKNQGLTKSLLDTLKNQQN